MGPQVYKIIDRLTRDGGRFVLTHAPKSGQWLAGMEFGQEAEDSPMAAVAAYGAGKTAEEALTDLVKELGA